MDEAPPPQLVAAAAAATAAAAAAAPDEGVLTTAVGGVLLTDTLKSIGADTVISIARDDDGVRDVVARGCSSRLRRRKRYGLVGRRKNAPVRARLFRRKSMRKYCEISSRLTVIVIVMIVGPYIITVLTISTRVQRCLNTELSR